MSCRWFCPGLVEGGTDRRQVGGVRGPGWSTAGLVLQSGESGSADPEMVSTSRWSQQINHETEDRELQGLAWSLVTQGSSVGLVEPRGRANRSLL